MATDATTTAADAPARAPIERTEHPHVVKSADTLGGEPRVEDTRIPVRRLDNLVEAGTTVAEIIETWPRLMPAQVHDAHSGRHTANRLPAAGPAAIVAAGEPRRRAFALDQLTIGLPSR